MSGKVTKHMIPVYTQMAAPTMFFSGFFQSPAQNFYASEQVEIDIVRSDEDISIVVTDIATGYRMNSADLYTNKEFKPAIHKEAVPINSFDLINRMPGQDPFVNPDYRANVVVRIFNAMVKVERKIRRAIELQASQVLQTGTVTLTDENGVALFTIDYKPKATHFPTSVTAWDQVGDDKMGDINSLAEVNRNDGLEDSDQLIFGDVAFNSFISDEKVLAQLDNRRIDRGGIGRPTVVGAGGTFQGTIAIGNYNYDMWTYAGRYKDPQTDLKVKYMAPEKVIVRSSMGRLDATFGAIPNIGQLVGGGANNILPELPGRVSNAAGGMDLFTNAWLSADGENLFAGIGARPLMIPTAIDTYGCLDTGL